MPIEQPEPTPIQKVKCSTCDENVYACFASQCDACVELAFYNAALYKTPFDEYVKRKDIAPVFFMPPFKPDDRGDSEGCGYYTEKEVRALAFRHEGPEYWWACQTVFPSTDAPDLVDQEIDFLDITTGVTPTPEHLKKLQAYLDKWWEESGVITYAPHPSRVLLAPTCSAPCSWCDKKK